MLLDRSEGRIGIKRKRFILESCDPLIAELEVGRLRNLDQLLNNWEYLDLKLVKVMSSNVTKLGNSGSGVHSCHRRRRRFRAGARTASQCPFIVIGRQ